MGFGIAGALSTGPLALLFGFVLYVYALFVPLVFGALAIQFGFAALVLMRARPGFDGKGVALGGIVVGAAALAIFMLRFIRFI